MNQTDWRAGYVERWARALEAQGEPRIAGRIYAHLATATEDHLSLQDLADQLGVSRGSVSTNTRRLIELGMIVRVPVPGSRGEHYAADPAGARAMVDRAAEAARALADLSREGLDGLTRDTAPGAASLRVMADVYERIAHALEQQPAPADRRTTS